MLFDRTRSIVFVLAIVSMIGFEAFVFLLVQGYSVYATSSLFWIFFSVWSIFGFLAVVYAGMADSNKAEQKRFNLAAGLMGLLLIVTYGVSQRNSNYTLGLFSYAFVGLYVGVGILAAIVLLRRGLGSRLRGDRVETETKELDGLH
jgi:hypothetical protein